MPIRPDLAAADSLDSGYYQEGGWDIELEGVEMIV